MDSLRYAFLTDMSRVRMEARRVLALMRFNDGDYDGALKQASKALSAATRFGFALRKVSPNSRRTASGEPRGPNFGERHTRAGFSYR